MLEIEPDIDPDGARAEAIGAAAAQEIVDPGEVIAIGQILGKNAQLDPVDRDARVEAELMIVADLAGLVEVAVIAGDIGPVAADEGFIAFDVEALFQ